MGGGSGGGGAARQSTPPLDYIQGACQLHLQARVTNPTSLEAVQRFLSGNASPATATDDTAAASGVSSSSPRLFIWVPRKQTSSIDDEEAEWDDALASTESFDGRNLGSLAFINASLISSSAAAAASSGDQGGNDSGSGSGSNAGEIKNARDLQCMVISPRIYLDEEEDEAEEGGDGSGESKEDSKENEARSSTNPGSATFLALQLYARHCFVPAVRAIEALEEEEEKKEGGIGDDIIDTDKAAKSSGKSTKILEGLEDKLRELDVALGQCRRTVLGRIPNVLLKPHPIIVEAATKLDSSGKIDLDAVGLSEYLNDDAFLNEVQSSVNHWIVQIRKVTVLPGSTPFPSGDSAETESHADLEEVSFWMGLEEALKNIRSELSKPSVTLTIALLKAAKRFVATIALENNTGLDGADAHVTDVSNFLRQYPAPTLASARDWSKIGNAMDAIFLHLPKVRQSRFYDLDRLARLMEASTLTLRERMEGTLRETYKGNGIVLGLDYEQYEKAVRGPTQDIFVMFDASFATFSEFFLDQGRIRRRAGDARNQTPAQVLKGIKLYHQALRERLDAVYYFRTQHEKLRSVVAEVLTGEKDDKSKSGGDDEGEAYSAWALKEVDEAPMSLFASVDVLDLSPRGETIFTSALEGYDRKVDAIEEHLAKLLRDKLSSCNDAEDMFRVFARFNPLLSRTRVSAAVKEFQLQLMNTVGQAVQKLQSKFTHKYESSSASNIATIRGIPPVSGKILWAKQMERQVHTLMKRMSDVLGKEWGQQLEGRQLRRSCDELLSKLDSRAYFRSWVTEWERELSSDTNSKLGTYPIIIAREGKSIIAKANFNEKHEYLSREIRYLKWLGYEKDIPRTIALVAEEAMARYPHASEYFASCLLGLLMPVCLSCITLTHTHVCRSFSQWLSRRHFNPTQPHAASSLLNWSLS